MSQPEIIQNCKNVIIEYLLDLIGQRNIVSVILYGSVARNEESYKYKGEKLYLESDLDVIVVVKNKMVVIKSWLILKRLCKAMSDKLRKNWVLSQVNLSITTENRLLHASPNAFDLHIRLNGKVIFGKELIPLMPSYGYNKYKDIPVPSLCNMIFCHMMAVVRNLASGGIIEGKVDVVAYDSILRSVRKLTLFMIRAIILKEGIPLNPYNLNEIKTKRPLCEIKNSVAFDDLLYSYDDIKSSDQGGNFSIDEISRCLDRVIIQFNTTVALLTGIKYPFTTLPKKLIFGTYTPVQRLRYALQHDTYLLVTNARAGWSTGLMKYIIFTLLRPEEITLTFYDLFVSSSYLIKTLNNNNSSNKLQREIWLKKFNRNFRLWKHGVIT